MSGGYKFASGGGSKRSSKKRAAYGAQPRRSSKKLAAYGAQPVRSSKKLAAYGAKPKRSSKKLAAYGAKPRRSSKKKPALGAIDSYVTTAEAITTALADDTGEGSRRGKVGCYLPNLEIRDDLLLAPLPPLAAATGPVFGREGALYRTGSSSLASDSAGVRHYSKQELAATKLPSGYADTSKLELAAPELPSGYADTSKLVGVAPAAPKASPKYAAKGLEPGHEDERRWCDLPIYFLTRTKTDFYDTTLGRIRYLDKEERREYEITIRGNFLMQGRKLLHTIGATALCVNPAEARRRVAPRVTDRWIFAMSLKGSIYAADWVEEYKEGGYYDALVTMGPAPREIVGFNHSSFLAGKPVACAGEIKVRNGQVEEISNQSGHYYPKPIHVYNFLCELRARAPLMDLSKIRLELMTSANRFAAGTFYDAKAFFEAKGDVTALRPL